MTSFNILAGGNCYFVYNRNWAKLLLSWILLCEYFIGKYDAIERRRYYKPFQQYCFTILKFKYCQHWKCKERINIQHFINCNDYNYYEKVFTVYFLLNHGKTTKLVQMKVCTKLADIHTIKAVLASYSFMMAVFILFTHSQTTVTLQVSDGAWAWSFRQYCR